ncbi:WXG100 family type VII secretion target [Paenibacillus oenotherae]|uniref:WXG100 family type VII secretion target n=1 Tax=Paenibacillus oenotherae TaxID=1435645 RepID=A0ABS7D6Q8_9BACL|nr:WXG100 family type VII secretion target [Paenibacillus oenotherae]MBW7475206.1 WXG100 family type VII secretion target [Paenibacillus oenotherae]
MVTSAYVYGLGRNCSALIQNAQNCSTQMTQAITGMSEYWRGIGGEQFEGNCLKWIKEMDQLQRDLISIQTSLNNHADFLKRKEAEEEAARQRALEQQREADRQRALQQQNNMKSVKR